MDPRARDETRRATRCFNLHKNDRAYTLTIHIRRKGIPVEYFEASERIFLSLDRAEARVRNIRLCNLLNRR